MVSAGSWPSSSAGRAGCVVLVARTVERLEGLRDDAARHPQLQVVVVSADLSDQAEVERALATIGAEVGEVDVLVNNAGVKKKKKKKKKKKGGGKKKKKEKGGRNPPHRRAGPGHGGPAAVAGY